MEVLALRLDDVTVRTEVVIGGGHAGGQLGWVHFGLGPSEEAEVRVQWPDGTVGPWMKVDANRFVVVDCEADDPVVWVPSDS